MSRQIERHAARTAAKFRAMTEKRQARTEAKRSLLERQSRREKAGFYGERGVAQDIAPSRSRRHTRLVQKGKPYGRIIKKIDGMELHATKGWRRA
ncbi:hypothetical protein [Microcystis phage Mae-JY35]